jgi:hypothetical protein
MPPVDPRKPLHDAHALAIGRLVVAWNGYQENLGELYATLFSRRDWALAMASWHALENDRAQRAMLLATATAKLASPKRDSMARENNERRDIRQSQHRNTHAAHVAY